MAIIDRPWESSALRANSRATRAAAAAGTDVIASCHAGVPGVAASSYPAGHSPGRPSRRTAYWAISRSNTVVTRWPATRAAGTPRRTIAPPSVLTLYGRHEQAGPVDLPRLDT